MPTSSKTVNNNTKNQSNDENILPLLRDYRFWTGLLTLIPFYPIFFITGAMLGGSERYFREIFDTTFAGGAIFGLFGLYLIIYSAFKQNRELTTDEKTGKAVLTPWKSYFPHLATMLALVVNSLYQMAMCIMYFVIFIQLASQIGNQDPSADKVNLAHVGLTITTSILALAPIILSIFAFYGEVKSFIYKYHHDNQNESSNQQQQQQLQQQQPPQYEDDIESGLAVQ